MSWRCSGRDKRCATCTFWGGARNVVSSNSYIETNSSSEKWRCLIPKGGRKCNEKLLNTSGCNDYLKWAVLR